MDRNLEDGCKMINEDDNLQFYVDIPSGEISEGDEDADDSECEIDLLKKSPAAEEKLLADIIEQNEKRNATEVYLNMKKVKFHHSKNFL